jgi:hypothetical protein
MVATDEGGDEEDLPFIGEGEATPRGALAPSSSSSFSTFSRTQYI